MLIRRKKLVKAFELWAMDYKNDPKKFVVFKSGEHTPENSANTLIEYLKEV